MKALNLSNQHKLYATDNARECFELACGALENPAVAQIIDPPRFPERGRPEARGFKTFVFNGKMWAITGIDWGGGIARNKEPYFIRIAEVVELEPAEAGL